MENNNPTPVGIVIIDLVNDDIEDCHHENANINDVVNERQHQRQIEEVAKAKEDCVYETEVSACCTDL